MQVRWWMWIYRQVLMLFTCLVSQFSMLWMNYFHIFVVYELILKEENCRVVKTSQPAKSRQCWLSQLCTMIEVDGQRRPSNAALIGGYRGGYEPLTCLERIHRLVTSKEAGNSSHSRTFTICLTTVSSGPRVLVYVLTGHNTFNQHLTIMRGVNDPLCLGTNLIHDFTAVTFSVKLAFREKRPIAHFREICEIPWTLWFFVNFNAFTFIYEGFQSFINSFCADFAVCYVSHFSTK